MLGTARDRDTTAKHTRVTAVGPSSSKQGRSRQRHPGDARERGGSRCLKRRPRTHQFIRAGSGAPETEDTTQPRSAPVGLKERVIYIERA